MNTDGNLETFSRMSASDTAHGFTPAAGSALARLRNARSGSGAVGSPAAPARRNSAGWVEEQIGGRIFERILITPSVANLGSVFTQQEVEVDIRNTFRAVARVMSGITVSGPGSAVVPAFVFPVGIPAMSVVAAILTFPGAGDPVIDESFDFVFSGFDGTTLVALGQRLAVFSIEADWDAGISETPQVWLTDVLKGLTDAEQRVQLRTLPRSRVKFKVLPTGRETAFLEGLLLAWQQYLFGVPFWPDKQPLLLPVEPGDAAISFDWSEREFAPGGYAVLWRDALTVEVVTLAALVVGGASLSGLLQNAWAADGRTWVVPIRRGRLADKVDLLRKNQETVEAEVVFEVEVV
jgi:hypothetical protein